MLLFPFLTHFYCYIFQLHYTSSTISVLACASSLTTTAHDIQYCTRFLPEKNHPNPCNVLQGVFTYRVIYPDPIVNSQGPTSCNNALQSISILQDQKSVEKTLTWKKWQLFSGICQILKLESRVNQSILCEHALRMPDIYCRFIASCDYLMFMKVITSLDTNILFEAPLISMYVLRDLDLRKVFSGYFALRVWVSRVRGMYSACADHDSHVLIHCQF